MADNISTLRKEVYDLVELLNSWASKFSNLLPVTYRSKIQWFGGIPGAIIEARETNRMVKMFNAVVIDDYSYGAISELAQEKIRLLGEKTRELQSLLGNDSAEKAKIGDEVIGAMLSFVKNWKAYAPDLARVVLDTGNKKEDKSFLENMLYVTANGITSLFFMAK